MLLTTTATHRLYACLQAEMPQVVISCLCKKAHDFVHRLKACRDAEEANQFSECICAILSCLNALLVAYPVILHEYFERKEVLRCVVVILCPVIRCICNVLVLVLMLLSPV